MCTNVLFLVIDNLLTRTVFQLKITFTFCLSMKSWPLLNNYILNKVIIKKFFRHTVWQHCVRKFFVLTFNINLPIIKINSIMFFNLDFQLYIMDPPSLFSKRYCDIIKSLEEIKSTVLVRNSLQGIIIWYKWYLFIWGILLGKIQL